MEWLEPWTITGETRVRFPLTTGAFELFAAYGITNIKDLLRAKDHLTSDDGRRVTGRNVVKLASQLKTGTKVRQLTSVTPKFFSVDIPNMQKAQHSSLSSLKMAPYKLQRNTIEHLYYIQIKKTVIFIRSFENDRTVVSVWLTAREF